MNKYVKFTGDFAQLKNMGFKFQKLYANNYMQWEKGGFRVWKGAKDVTSDRISDLYQFLKCVDAGMMRLRKSKFGKTQNYIVEFHVHNDEHETVYIDADEGEKIRKEQMNLNDEEWKLIADKDVVCSNYIPEHYLDTYKELKELGWIELVD